MLRDKRIDNEFFILSNKLFITRVAGSTEEVENQRIFDVRKTLVRWTCKTVLTY